MDAFRGYHTETVNVTVGDRSLALLVPENCEALLDSPAVVERFDQDEYLPYWMLTWPSGARLAEIVNDWTADPDDAPSVLELGCGLGLASLVLAARGFRVTASDYDADALAFARENARRNNLSNVETRFVDWREVYADLSFDRIVAADVLYETRNLRPVAEFVSRHLRPNGFALVVDPCRMVADDFPTVARHCELDVEVSSAKASPGDASKKRSRTFTLKRRRESI